MPLPHNTIYTINDIYNLPDGTRAELIDGQIYYMAPPSRKHQRIVTELSVVITNYIKANAGTCEVDVSPFAVFLNADDETYVEPDVSVICDKDKLNDRGCNGAPDWIVEIVSPSSRKMDYYTKLTLYKDAGVRLYWVIDPERNSVMVHDLENEAMPVIYSMQSEIPVSIYPGFSINFADLDLE